MSHSDENIVPMQTGKRIKKAKVVFDPSLNNLPRKRVLNPFSLLSSYEKKFKKAHSTSITKNQQQKIQKERYEQQDQEQQLEQQDQEQQLEQQDQEQQLEQQDQEQQLEQQDQEQQQEEKDQEEQCESEQEQEEEQEQCESEQEQEEEQEQCESEQEQEEQSQQEEESNDDSDYSNPPIFEPEIIISPIIYRDLCFECRRKEYDHSKLINCQHCGFRVHPQCIPNRFQNFDLVRERWCCGNCRKCIICNETQDYHSLITCCICVHSYHCKCHIPRIHKKEINRLKWKCITCSYFLKDFISLEKIDQKLCNSKINENNHDDDDADNDNEKQSKKQILLSSSSESELSDEESESESEPEIKAESESGSEPAIKTELVTETEEGSELGNESELESGISLNDLLLERKQTKIFMKFFKSKKDIPDISEWSSDKLANYIEKYLPNIGNLFREENIDGEACLLMKRSDVINDLSLDLGPALRLYSLVVALQTRQRNPTLTWM